MSENRNKASGLTIFFIVHFVWHHSLREYAYPCVRTDVTRHPTPLYRACAGHDTFYTRIYVYRRALVRCCAPRRPIDFRFSLLDVVFSVHLFSEYVSTRVSRRTVCARCITYRGTEIHDSGGRCAREGPSCTGGGEREFLAVRFLPSCPPPENVDSSY